MKLWIAFLVLSAAIAQKPSLESEESDLSAALAEAGTSQIDFVRALERHLARHPDTAKKPEIERALVKAAIETERVLERGPGDPQTLDRVTRALLSSDAKDTSQRALKYARRYGEQVASLRAQPPVGHFGRAEWMMELDRGLARGLVLESRATGNLGKHADALDLAKKSYEEFPTAEGAREIGRWLIKLGHEEEAIPRYADAFTISDTKNTDTARIQDRSRMGELYKKVKGSEKGLGDLILESYDRTTALLAERRLRMV